MMTVTVPTLRNINLSIEAGHVVALVGTSGAGKSTLMNLIPRFFDPSEGNIYFDGVDIRKATLASLRGQTGLVTQEIVLFNDTVRNNLTYGVESFSIEELEKAARAACALEFIEALPEGFNTTIGERGHRLSGGQRQRLAIARAIMKNPPILILDEATSSLDAESEALVQRALENLMATALPLSLPTGCPPLKSGSNCGHRGRSRFWRWETHAESIESGEWLLPATLSAPVCSAEDVMEILRKIGEKPTRIA